MFGLVKLGRLSRLSCVPKTDYPLVLDFRQQPTTDVVHRKNMYRFMVSYVEQIMATLSPSDHVWTFDAADFLDILYSGELPSLSVSRQKKPTVNVADRRILTVTAPIPP